MKRAVMRAVLTLLMLALPVAAQGQMTTQTVVEDGRTRATLAAFAEEAPQAVRSLMDGYGLGDARCVCGAALEKEPMAGDASADGLLFTSSALVVVERGGAYALAGLRWEPGGSNARVEDFGALGLPLDGDCAVEPLWDEIRGCATSSCCFPQRRAGGVALRVQHTKRLVRPEYAGADGARMAFLMDGSVAAGGGRFYLPVKPWLGGADAAGQPAPDGRRDPRHGAGKPRGV